MIALLALLQTAAPAPDIELNVHARAKSVEIRQEGEARLEVRAEPDAGSSVETRVEPPARGRTKLRNVTVDVHARASLGGRPEIQAKAETGTPQ